MGLRTVLEGGRRPGAPTPMPSLSSTNQRPLAQVFNPPYVPTPDEEVSRDGIARAWAGGHRGRRVIDRVLQKVSPLAYLEA
jgi:hypothetical protein